MSYGGQYGGAPGGGYGGPPQGGGYGGGQGGYGAPSGGPPPYGGAPGGHGGHGGHAGPGGFAAAQGPPPGADPKLWGFFTAVAGPDGHIQAHELQSALINGDWTAFDLDTVKLLMTMFDTDRSGTIGFNEFAGLWKYIQDWQGVFRHFDTDRSGSIEGGELAQALQQFGYNLSPQLISLVQRKYDPKASAAPGGHGPSSGITFDRFVRACVVIKQLSESFRRLDTDHDGWIQINYDQFMQTVLTLP